MISSLLLLPVNSKVALMDEGFSCFYLTTFLSFLKASSEHSVCFAVPEKEADTVRRALEKKFRRDLDAGRLSKV